MNNRLNTDEVLQRLTERAKANTATILHERAERERLEEERQRLRALHELASKMGRRYAPGIVSLENYQTPHRGQAKILSRVKAIAARLVDSVKAGEPIVFHGSAGAGKDHLLASLMHLAIGKDLSVSWWAGGTLLDRLGQAARGNRSDDSQLSAAYDADILAISDPSPPRGSAPEWLLAALHTLIDHRYSQMRATWMTVNASTVEELAAKLSNQTADRLRHGGHLLPTFWPSWRTA